MSVLEPSVAHVAEPLEISNLVATGPTGTTSSVPAPPTRVQISWNVDSTSSKCSSPVDSFLSALDETPSQHEHRAGTLAWLQTIINIVPIRFLRQIWDMSGQRIRQYDFESGRSIWIANGHRVILRNELYPHIYTQVADDKREWDALVGEMEMEETIAALQAILRAVPMEVLERICAVDKIRVIDEETGKWFEKLAVGHRKVVEEALGPKMCEDAGADDVGCGEAERADTS